MCGHGWRVTGVRGSTSATTPNAASATARPTTASLSQGDRAGKSRTLAATSPAIPVTNLTNTAENASAFGSRSVVRIGDVGFVAIDFVNRSGERKIDEAAATVDAATAIATAALAGVAGVVGTAARTLCQSPLIDSGDPACDEGSLVAAVVGTAQYLAGKALDHLPPDADALRAEVERLVGELVGPPDE